MSGHYLPDPASTQPSPPLRCSANQGVAASPADGRITPSAGSLGVPVGRTDWPPVSYADTADDRWLRLGAVLTNIPAGAAPIATPNRDAAYIQHTTLLLS